jgi:hypothetical protein
MSISDYTDKFEEIMAVIREEHPYLQEHYYIVSFVNGLRPAIKCNLRPQRPTSLSDAYWMARDYENGLASMARHPHTFAQQGYRQGVPQKLMTGPPNEKAVYVPPPARKPGVCWRCNAPWQPGHKCQQAPAIHALTSDNPEPAIKQEPEEIANEDSQSDNPEDNQLMHISSNAVSGIKSTDTITVTVCIGGKLGLALVDTGSTSTFIDVKFALKTSCQILNNSVKTVTVLVVEFSSLVATFLNKNFPFTVSNFLIPS